MRFLRSDSSTLATTHDRVSLRTIPRNIRKFFSPRPERYVHCSVFTSHPTDCQVPRNLRGTCCCCGGGGGGGGDGRSWGRRLLSSRRIRQMAVGGPEAAGGRLSPPPRPVASPDRLHRVRFSCPAQLGPCAVQRCAATSHEMLLLSCHATSL